MLIELEPTPMTHTVMKDLEARGLIIRLAPGAHSNPVPKGQSKDITVYASDPANGPHKLIFVTIDAYDPAPYFGTHVDNEEFLFIGDPASKPMFLIVALCKRAELEAKIANRTLSAADLVALRAKFNDPEVSFFTMLKDVPHGEVTVDRPGPCATFYVTEPRDIESITVDLKGYQLKVMG